MIRRLNLLVGDKALGALDDVLTVDRCVGPDIRRLPHTWQPGRTLLPVETSGGLLGEADLLIATLYQARSTSVDRP